MNHPHCFSALIPPTTESGGIRNFLIAMRALAEGNALRGTGRIVEVGKDTVCDWVDRAGRHCWAVTTYLFDTLHITECQGDELWSFVRKKEAHLSVAEKVLALYGDAWVWIAFAPAWRLVAALVVGKRDQAHANVLLERVHAVSCGYIPFFTSDQLPHYAHALLHVYGTPEILCTSRANAALSLRPSVSPLLTCSMLRSSSAGKAGVWWRRPPRSSSARKQRCKRAWPCPRSARRFIPVLLNATT